MNRVLQIYYKEEQLPALEYEPYNNPPSNDRRYLFMESNVIAKAFHYEKMHIGYKYSGVLSPGFKDKLNSFHAFKWDEGFMQSHKDFTPERLHEFLDTQDADVVSLTKAKPHDVVALGALFHANFGRTFRTLNALLGDPSMRFWADNPIYFNYFMGTESFMTEFSSYMDKCIKLMCLDPELNSLMWTNSGYKKDFPLKEQFGIDYWPLHPFVAERLISIYIQKHKAKVAYFL